MSSFPHQFFNPQVEQKNGRIIQLVWLLFVAVLSLGGILVQVYTEVELSANRDEIFQEISHYQELVQNIYDLTQLIGREMALAFRYSNTSYDTYLQMSMDTTKAVDTALMWMSSWPTESEFSEISPAMRVNLASPTVLRTAIRAQRDLRKTTTTTTTTSSAHGAVDEMSVLNFYVPIIDQLSVLARSLITKTPRFQGWQDYLGMTPVFQTWMNFKKYEAVGEKLAYENRTLSTTDDVYRALLEYYNKYVQLISVASEISSFARDKMANLTSLDAYKDVDKIHSLLVLGMDFGYVDYSTFDAIASVNDRNIEYVLKELTSRIDNNVKASMGIWPQTDIFSAPIYAVATAIAFATLFVHIAATWRQQKQIIKNYDKLNDLNEALAVVYDCIPKSFIDTARSRSIMDVQHFDDVGILVMDICNVEQMMSDLSLDSFVSVVEQTYELVEKVLRKYSCFKVEIAGSYFVLASGAGEYHVLNDHVLELVLVALDLEDAVDELSRLDQEDDYDVSLRIGIHVGPCCSRVVYLQVPRLVLVGATMELANLVHSASLPLRVQVSGAVYQRLASNAGSIDVEFIHRGQMQLNDKDSWNVLDLYWAQWNEDNQANNSSHVDAERLSLTSSLYLNKE